MRKDLISKIDNVKEAFTALKFLTNRDKERMVGLALLHGAPGLGKTWFAKRYVLDNPGCVYIRLEQTDTNKTFLTRLFYECTKVVGDEKRRASGSANKIFHSILEILHKQALTIFIDEIDYAFKKRQLLGAIRDIVDESYAQVILVGMQINKVSLFQSYIQRYL